MRDLYEVLREKEKAVARVGREIRILRLAVALLTDGTDMGPMRAATPDNQETPKVLHVAHAVTDDADGGGTESTGGIKLGTATKISARLKRLATPLLSRSVG